MTETRGQAGIPQPEASPAPGLAGVTFQLGVLFLKLLPPYPLLERQPLPLEHVLFLTLKVSRRLADKDHKVVVPRAAPFLGLCTLAHGAELWP